MASLVGWRFEEINASARDKVTKLAPPHWLQPVRREFSSLALPQT